MPATTEVREYHGASPGSGTAITSTRRHKRADDSEQTLDGPIPIPASGVNYGWRKHHKMWITTDPITSVGNIRWFMEAEPGVDAWLGITLYAGTLSSYTQASASDEAGVGGLVDATVYTSANPMTVAAAASIMTTAPSSGATQPYVVTQLGVLSTASANLNFLLRPRSCGYRYDEV